MRWETALETKWHRERLEKLGLKLKDHRYVRRMGDQQSSLTSQGWGISGRGIWGGAGKPLWISDLKEGSGRQRTDFSTSQQTEDATKRKSFAARKMLHHFLLHVIHMNILFHGAFLLAGCKFRLSSLVPSHCEIYHHSFCATMEHFYPEIVQLTVNIVWNDTIVVLVFTNTLNFGLLTTRNIRF